MADAIHLDFAGYRPTFNVFKLSVRVEGSAGVPTVASFCPLRAPVGPSTRTGCEVLACQFALDPECFSRAVTRGGDGKLNAF